MLSNAVTLSNIRVSAGTTSNLLSAVTFDNSNGISFGLNGSVVTGTVATSYAPSNHSHGNPTLNLTNLSGTTASASNGFTLSLSAAAPGAGGGFAAQGSGVYTQNTGTIQWANSNGITFGLSTNQMTASHNGLTTAALSDHSHGNPTLALTNLTGTTASASNGFTLSLSAANPGGGAGVTASYFENMPILFPGSTTMTVSGSSLRVQPFMLPYAVSMSYVRFPVSVSHVQSTAGTPVANTSFSARRGQTDCVVIYSQGVGASSRSIQYVASGSAVWTMATTVSAGTASSQYTVSYNITHPSSGSNNSNFVTNYGASSASIVLSSSLLTRFSGPRFLDVPLATVLGPGNYWIAIGRSTSTQSQSANISFATNASLGFSTVGVSQSALSWGPMGAVSSASDNQLQPGAGVWTTNAFQFSTSSIALSQVSNVASHPRFYFQFIRMT
jgi:hypothetical protein